MAITCPHCGAHFDVTLFQFGHTVQCDCGAWVELARGHVAQLADPPAERTGRGEPQSFQIDPEEK